MSDNPVPFPQPDQVINNRRYWLLSTLLQWEAAQSGKTAVAVPVEDDVLLGSPKVRKRYDNISDMTLWRWLNPAAASQAA